MWQYPYITHDGINKGKDYTCLENEYAVLNSTAKRWEIRTIPKLDDTIIKKTIIQLKGNNKGSTHKLDMFTGKHYIDNVSKNSILFTGTEKALSDYATELISKGYNIKDFYDYEE